MMQIQLFKQTLENLPELQINEENINIAKELREYAKTLGNCAGLAIPQVGINKRICVVIREETDVYNFIVAINPKVVNYYETKFESVEGCLSWPGKFVIAERYPKVKISYYDVDREEHIEEIYSGFVGKVWQHEIDHLNGKQEKIFDRDFRTVKNAIKIGRNDPCICGSGKKYKKCCGVNK